jgi:hypothetical protein
MGKACPIRSSFDFALITLVGLLDGLPASVKNIKLNSIMSSTSNQRRNISMALIIIAGLVIGIFIKRVQVGLLIGVVLGLLAAGLSSSKK